MTTRSDRLGTNGATILTMNTSLVAAAAAAVAVAVSGCSSVTAGHPSAATAAAPAPAAATATASAPVAHSWRDVTGEVTLTLPQVGTQPVPGIMVTNSKGDCTLGVAVRGSSGDGFLTAGHCFGDAGGTQRIGRDGEVPLGTMVDAVPRRDDGEDHHNPDGTRIDAGLVTAESVPRDAVRIAGRYPVAGVLTAEAAKRLVNAGVPVCIDGKASGVVCGRTHINGADHSEVNVDRSGEKISQPGDSGSVVFLVEDGTGRAALVGIEQGGLAGILTTITYLDPTLSRFGVRALLDPDVEPFSADDPADFSANVQPYS